MRTFVEWAAEHHHNAVMAVFMLLPVRPDNYIEEYLMLGWIDGQFECANSILRHRCHYDEQIIRTVEDKISQHVLGLL